MEIKLDQIITPNKEIGSNEGFFADLIIKGVRAGQTKNEGGGAVTVYRPANHQDEKLIKEAEDYCEGIANEIITLSRKIDILFLWHEAIAHESDVRHYKSGMELDSIVTFDVHKKLFRRLVLKVPIASLLKTANAKKTIFGILKEFIFPCMQSGDIILNKNLPPRVMHALSSYYRFLANGGDLSERLGKQANSLHVKPRKIKKSKGL